MLVMIKIGQDSKIFKEDNNDCAELPIGFGRNAAFIACFGHKMDILGDQGPPAAA